MCIRDRSKGAISQQTYDTALMNYKVAKAAYEQAVSNTNDTAIYSPIDGYEMCIRDRLRCFGCMYIRQAAC